MPQDNPAPGNSPGLPVQNICNGLSELRDQLLLLSLIFNQQDAGQAIQDCQRQSKSGPEGSAKCYHFGVGIITA